MRCVTRDIFPANSSTAAAIDQPVLLLIATLANVSTVSRHFYLPTCHRAVIDSRDSSFTPFPFAILTSLRAACHARTSHLTCTIPGPLKLSRRDVSAPAVPQNLTSDRRCHATHIKKPFFPHMVKLVDTCPGLNICLIETPRSPESQCSTACPGGLLSSFLLLYCDPRFLHRCLCLLPPHVLPLPCPRKLLHCLPPRSEPLKNRLLFPRVFPPRQLHRRHR
jgi:hypothetical protein